jgi:hypothetical protein
MELQSLHNPCTKKEIRRYGAAYKQNSSEQLVKPNKLLLETLLIDNNRNTIQTRLAFLSMQVKVLLAMAKP